MAEVVEMHRLCELFHCLPRAGALIDQDALTMTLLSLVASADAERQARETEARRRAIQHT